MQHVRQLIGPGVADDRAVQPREARPIHRRAGFAFVLVAANEREGVAAAGVGERDAGVARRADAGRNTRHHLEPHALLVQEQRLGAAVIEDKRIAPLQARDNFSLAGFFREQVANRFLLERLRRGHPDIDAFGLRARRSQQPRMHQVVVQARRRLTRDSAAREPR